MGAVNNGPVNVLKKDIIVQKQKNNIKMQKEKGQDDVQRDLEHFEMVEIRNTTGKVAGCRTSK